MNSAIGQVQWEPGDQILTQFMLRNMPFDVFNCGMKVKLAIISEAGDFYHS